MRASTKVLAGTSGTASVTLPICPMVTVPVSGPCAHAFTSDLLSATGGRTSMVTSETGSSHSSPMNFQYSSAVSE